MAKTKNDPDTIKYQLRAIIGHEVNIRINDYKKALEKSLVTANKRFFAKYATIVGATSGRFDQSWLPLTEKYANFRGRQFGIPQDQFFRRQGGLGRALKALGKEVDTILGRPTVTLHVGSRKFKSGYSEGIQKTTGKPYYLGPDRKFTSLKAALLEDIPHKITINAFPMVDPKVFTSGLTSGVAEKTLTATAPDFDDPPGRLLPRFDEKLGRNVAVRRKKGAAQNRTGPLFLKLGVRKGGVIRPTAGPLLNWWMKNEIRRIVEKVT